MKHILVIEDETLIRDEIVILLENAGYQVDKLTDFKDTSQQVLQYDTDLIILRFEFARRNRFPHL